MSALALVTWGISLAWFAVAAEARAPASRSIAVNGVQLEYLDWGGQGDPLVFLAGQGDTPHIFNDLAPEFRDQFHCLGLTRRGFGGSEQPEAGYDLDNLVQDVASFIEALHLRNATIVGHSFGGAEAIRLSELHPDLIRRIVLLDTAYGRTSAGFIYPKLFSVLTRMSEEDSYRSLDSLREYWKRIRSKWPPESGERHAWSDAAEASMRESVIIKTDGSLSPRTPDRVLDAMNKNSLSFTQVPVPALLIFAHNPISAVLPHLTLDASTAVEMKKASDEIENARREQIEALRRDAPKAKIVEFDHTGHYCFIQRRREVLKEMKRFLR